MTSFKHQGKSMRRLSNIRKRRKNRKLNRKRRLLESLNAWKRNRNFSQIEVDTEAVDHDTDAVDEVLQNEDEVLQDEDEDEYVIRSPEFDQQQDIEKSNYIGRKLDQQQDIDIKKSNYIGKKKIVSLIVLLCSNYFSSLMGQEMSAEYIQETSRRVMLLITFKSAIRIVSRMKDLVIVLNYIADHPHVVDEFAKFGATDYGFAPSTIKHYIATFQRFFSEFYLYQVCCNVTQERKDAFTRMLSRLSSAYDKAARKRNHKHKSTPVEQLISDQRWPADGLATIRTALDNQVDIQGALPVTNASLMNLLVNVIVSMYVHAVQPRIGYIEAITKQQVIALLEQGNVQLLDVIIHSVL